MKVIDKQLLFISSDERDSGSISDFTVAMPSHLLTCRPNQKMRMVLNDVVMPYTWYNVQETNRHFEVIENGGTAFKVSLDVGSYHAIQLRDHLIAKLNAASAASSVGYTYTVTFDEVSSKFTFSIGSPSGANSFAFTSETNDLSASAYKLLGFVKGSTNTFTGSTLVSTGAVSMMFSDALYLHCDLLNTNVDKRAGTKSVFHLSTAFAKIMINTSPFNNIIFLNQNDDYMLNIIDQRVTELHFWITTAEHGVINLNDDFSFTLKVEVYEDGEKTLISQNSGLGELLRLLLLQNQVLNDRKSAD
jgi:hypothetical protein